MNKLPGLIAIVGFVFIQLSILSLPLAGSADFTCGNGVCDPHETHLSCSNDCPAGGRDNLCEDVKDSVCDSDCTGSDPDCSDYSAHILKDAKNPLLLVVAGAMSIMIIAGLVILFRKIADEKVKSERKMYDPRTQRQETPKEKGWSNSTEQEILDKMRDNEEYRRYADGK